MKKLTYLVVLMFAMVLMNSCSKSTKTILMAGEEWLVTMTSESIQNSSNQVLKFVDSTTILLGETNSYNISWLNDNVFRLNAEGMTAIFNIMYYSEDKLKVAVLYENEKIPATEEEWSKLQDENRVIQLVKHKSLEESPKSYIICGNNIPADKVPPTGIYLNRGYSGDVMGVVKVIISNEVVQFQTGENESSLKDTPIESYDEFGNFSLKDFMLSGSFDGNGVIKFNNGAMGVDEGEQYDNYIIESNSYSDVTANSFTQAINYASNIGYIFKGGETSGKLVIKKFKGKYFHWDTGVEELDIPEGKMWTLLYAEVTDESTVPMIRIYPEKSGDTWYREDYFTFDEGKDSFISIKYSKQQYKPLVWKTHPAIQYTDNPKATLTIYFFEESIY